MRANKAFILISAQAYIACLALTIMDKPPLPDINPLLQGIIYIILALLLLGNASGFSRIYGIIKNTIDDDGTPDYIGNSSGKIFWTIIYGTGAMFAFTGAVRWSGGDNAGFFMCLWDLALGTALLID